MDGPSVSPSSSARSFALLCDSEWINWSKENKYNIILKHVSSTIVQA